MYMVMDGFLPADAPPEREALHVGLSLARQCPDHRPRLAHGAVAVADVLGALAARPNMYMHGQLKKKTQVMAIYDSGSI